MALQGRGMERDAGLAYRLFERAARQGFADAQHNLAMLFEHGLGTV